MSRVFSRKHLRGITTILWAAAAPFAGWGAGEVSLRAAITLGVIAGLGAASNWLAETPRRRELPPRASA